MTLAKGKEVYELRKLLVMSVLALVGVGAAYGFGLTVPFILDQDGGYATYVGVRNNTDDDILVVVKDRAAIPRHGVRSVVDSPGIGGTPGLRPGVKAVSQSRR